MKTTITRQTGNQGYKSHPSNYVDRLMGFVARLPIPYWVTYLVLFLLQSAVFHFLAWSDGWLDAYTFNTLILLYPLWLWAPLAIMTYLDSTSLDALSSFEPLLDITDNELQQLKDEFTTMPTRNVIISSLIWVAVYILLTYLNWQSFYLDNGLSTPFIVTSIIAGLFPFFIGSTIYYHSIRQLRLVNRTVKMVKQFNLFHLEPVYTFSRVTARTGIAWVLLLSFTLLLFPIQLSTLPTLVMFAIQIVLAIAAFMLPLWVVHQRLIEEKRRLVSELNQRVEETIAKLHLNLDKNQLNEVPQLNDALAALNAEREILNKIPTWPWPTGVLTGFLSAIVLPVVLFLLQFFLGNLLGN
jgi:hypothetical protein